MSDVQIIEALQAEASRSGAVKVAELLDKLTTGGLSQSTLISFFKRAFPEIPLRTLIDASGWTRVSGGGLSDADFGALLDEWLPIGVHESGKPNAS